MSRLKFVLAVVGAIAIAPASYAQQPARQNPPPQGPAREPRGPRGGGPGAGPRGGMDAASMLLAHTGELKLTDAQVTRLAAIARRSADRRTTMRTMVDSLRTVNRPAVQQGPPGPGRQGPPPMALAQVEKMREAMHADLKDAIAVLSPDQQAQGWEMMARRRPPPGAAPIGREQ